MREIARRATSLGMPAAVIEGKTMLNALHASSEEERRPVTREPRC